MKASEALLSDVTIGLTAGMVATRMVSPIQDLLYRFTPQSAKSREEQVSPGPPTWVAAKALTGAAGARLTSGQLRSAATAIHYGSGMPWGLIYAFLRRHSGMTPAGAALATGASMSLILDETLTPAMGFSARDRNYPTATHVRGFMAHLAFGAVLAATAEMLYRLTGSGPDRQEARPVQ